MHCSVMRREALEVAAANYNSIKPPKPEEGDELVCECFGVTDKKIRHAIIENDLKSREKTERTCERGADSRD